MNIPPDLDHSHVPNASPPDLNADFALKKKGSKTPLVIALVVVGGAVGLFARHAIQTQKTREMHAAVIGQFADVEKNDVIGKFWT
ncbi:MAG: hypothetical protein ACRETG_10550, partial [Steroidobacteraceae bacterium]